MFERRVSHHSGTMGSSLDEMEGGSMDRDAEIAELRAEVAELRKAVQAALERLERVTGSTPDPRSDRAGHREAPSTL